MDRLASAELLTAHTCVRQKHAATGFKAVSGMYRSVNAVQCNPVSAGIRCYRSAIASEAK